MVFGNLSNIFNKNVGIRVILFIFISYCFNIVKSIKAEELELKSVKQYYLDGLYYYADRSYTSSAEQFEALTKNHPFSNFSKEAVIMECYTNYINGEYSKIDGVAEVFYRLFQNDEYTPYIMYLQAMAIYSMAKDETKAVGFLDESEKIFNRIVNEFPNTKYSEASIIKLDYINKMKQLQDIRIGEFFQERGEYIASIRRYTGMFETYKNKLIPEIEERLLCRIITLSKMLEMKNNVDKYTSLLKQKYSNSKCLK